MKPEELLGLAIPLVYILLLAIESRYAARAFEQFRRWRYPLHSPPFEFEPGGFNHEVQHGIAIDETPLQAS